MTAMETELAKPVEPLIDIQDLKKHFPVRRGLFSRTVGQVYAVDGVSLTVNPGETVGLVGESGCGKSTVGKTILKLVEPTSGSISIRGRDITRLGPRAMRRYRQELQVIFQDPYSSLNPRMTVGEIIEEPMRNFAIGTRAERRQQVAYLLDRVGLRAGDVVKYPHEFSGGQRQRLGIARALALKPALIIGDEPVSALDVSVQAQVVNLMNDLQEEFGLSYLFIAHDLAVVAHISHRVAVMYLGRIVEMASRRDLFARPQHPYTQALMSSVPIPDPALKNRDRIILEGDVPSPIDRPKGCHFNTRCPYAVDRCFHEEPLLKSVGTGHTVACHLR